MSIKRIAVEKPFDKLFWKILTLHVRMPWIADYDERYRIIDEIRHSYRWNFGRLSGDFLVTSL